MAVTIKDIAKTANVSYATVSRALSDQPEISRETKDRIRKIARQMGYIPNAIARGLVTRITYTIGLVIPDITNPFFPDVAQGIEDCAGRNGYRVFLCNTNWNIDKEKEYIMALHESRVDGIVLAPAHDDISYLKQEFNGDIPMVLAAYKPEDSDFNYVVTDNFKSSFIATQYLAKLGHRNIAFIGGNEDGTTNKERLAGYMTALGDFGIPIDKCLIKNGKFTQKSGYRLAKGMFIQNSIPTAVLAGNDIIALGVIRAIEEFGLNVPGNVSVIGIDDITFSGLYKVQLTTVFQDRHKIGEMCMDILLKKISDPKDKNPAQLVLEPGLIIRKTCRGL